MDGYFVGLERDLGEVTCVLDRLQTGAEPRNYRNVLRRAQQRFLEISDTLNPIGTTRCPRVALTLFHSALDDADIPEMYQSAADAVRQFSQLRKGELPRAKLRDLYKLCEKFHRHVAVYVGM